MQRDDVNVDMLKELMNKLKVNWIPLIYQLRNIRQETSAVRID